MAAPIYSGIDLWEEKMSSGVDISAVVSRLKRQINKKQLKFASLTQEFNTVQEKYIEKWSITKAISAGSK